MFLTTTDGKLLEVERCEECYSIIHDAMMHAEWHFHINTRLNPEDGV
jgi:hypothetical protein